MTHNLTIDARGNSKTNPVLLANTVAGALGMAPAADITALIEQVDERIDRTEAELAQLRTARTVLITLHKGEARQRKPRGAGAPSATNRILGILSEQGPLCYSEISTALAADGHAELPLGTVAWSMSKLNKSGRIARHNGTWRLVEVSG